MTKWGTNNFVSKAAAVRYYRRWFEDRRDAITEVDRKIAEEEIAIGKPKVEEGETLVLIDDDTRYAILDNSNAQ